MLKSAQKALDALAEALNTLRPYKRLLVAFSGGCDSTALLHAARQVEQVTPLVAIHVNHGLSANAQAWQSHCEAFAEGLNIRLISEVVQVRDTGEGLEAAAREARYQALARHVQPGDLLLTAHHENDQAETMLLRLFRGTGPSGLAAIKPVRQLHSAGLVRPWLDLTRADLEAYARTYGLSWVNDESNRDAQFDRNYIRLDLMPQISVRWPAAQRNMARLANLLAEQQVLLDEYAQQDFEALSPRSERLGNSICVAPLRAWSDARAACVVRYWLARNHANPTAAQLRELARQLDSGQDRQPLLVLGGCVVRRFAERLYCLPQLPESDFSVPTSWHTGGGRLRLPDGSELTAAEHSGGGLKPGEYRVALRGRTIRCHPATRHRSQTLKKLLQEYQLEPWLRSRIPLLYDGEQLAAVGDLWVEQRYFTPRNGLALCWRFAGSAEPSRVDLPS